MENYSDDELIEEYLKGEEYAFEILFYRYKNMIFSYLFALSRNEDLSNDLLQEIFIKVINNLKKYKKENKFKSWLYTLARNTFYDFKKSKTEKNLENIKSLTDKEDESYSLEETISSDENPEKNFLKEEKTKLILEKIDLLNEDQKEIIFLKHYSGLSFKEISEILKVPMGTLLARFSRALNKIEESLNRGH